MKRAFMFSLTGTALALFWASCATAADVESLGCCCNGLSGCEDGHLGLSLAWKPAAKCGCRGTAANPCCYPLWTASTDALVLRRDGIDDVPLVVDTGTGADLFNARDIDLDFQAAPRVSVARRLFGCHDIEFEFFGVNSLADTATVGGAGAQFTVYGAAFGAEPINLAFSSSLYSAELNWRRSWCCDRVKVLAGFRWIELDDDATVRDAASPPPLFIGSTENQLYGFQLGIEGTLLQRGRLEIEAGFKGGVYGNRADVNAAFPQAGPDAVFTADGEKTAFVGEVMVGLNYNLTNCLALRAGYQMLWIDGVALLPEQLDDLAVPIAGEAEMGGRPVYHGYHVGLQCEF
ncbi:MAG: hypothetical protein HQ582_13340 [Planctomycetes bacterium]|nr:hypothetical protein [Planctomycetota bacterium]